MCMCMCMCACCRCYLLACDDWDLTETEVGCGWFQGAVSLGSESYDTEETLLSIRERVGRGNTIQWQEVSALSGVPYIRSYRNVFSTLGCGVASVGCRAMGGTPASQKLPRHRCGSVVPVIFNGSNFYNVKITGIHVLCRLWWRFFVII